MEVPKMDYQTGKWLERHDEEIREIIQVLISAGIIKLPEEKEQEGKKQ